MRVLCLIGTWLLAMTAAPAGMAADFEVQNAPKRSIIKVDEAQHQVQLFLKTLPNLPADVLVLPGSGTVPWPGVRVSENVKAEVWTAVAGSDPTARPFVMFAVRPDTGEVYVMYLRKLEPPTAKKPVN